MLPAADSFSPNRLPRIFPVANIKSAKKRAKQTVVRNERNVAQRSMLRTAVKKVLKAINENDAAGAQAAFATAQPILDRFSSRGLIPLRRWSWPSGYKKSRYRSSSHGSSAGSMISSP